MARPPLSAARLTQRADVFSLGAVPYELVSGLRAFAGRSPRHRHRALELFEARAAAHRG